MEDHSQPLTVVSVTDPAIDRSKTDLRAYAGDAANLIPGDRDLSRVVALPGATLRTVTLRPLKVGEVAAIRAVPGDSGAVQAFALAVTKIDHAYGVGHEMRPGRHVRAADGRDIRVWDDADVQLVMEMFGYPFIIEMGQLAVERADMGKACGGSANYMLPPLCTLAMMRINARLAEHDARTEAQARTERSASDRTPSATDSPKPSDEATDAPAKGGTESQGGAPPQKPTDS